MTKYNASDIANWFLNYNKAMRNMESDDIELISNLKLQKLLYYAQGSYLALKNELLFNEKIKAWKHGPVVLEVYNKYKKYKSNGIDEFETVDIDDETTAVLREVYDVFGVYSAWGLRNKTHNEKPWQETEQNDEIKIDLMKSFFKETYID